MKFMLLLPKFKKLSSSIPVESIFKSTQWKNWSLKDALVLKKWRGFLNPQTVLHGRERNVPFQHEEVILVTENRFGGSSRLVRLMLDTETKLKTRSGKINSLEHNVIIGKSDGDVVSLKDIPYRLQRATLEDYVLHMKRIATPSYPKDIQAMLSMAEVRQGSFVLEAGTGSGALTLYLSNAVGKEGRVYSFDNNERHLKKAKENVMNWISSWNKTKHPLWPENMTYYSESLRSCRERLPTSSKVDSILLDLQSPENYLEFLIPIVKQESPVVIFLPSITQVVDVVSHCNKKKLPFHIDKVIEVTHRSWKIQPVTPVDRELDEKHDENNTENQSSIIERAALVKYTAKPSFQQLPHTGFILKLIHRE